MKLLKFLTLLCFLLLVTNAFALRYNYFEDNGSWFEYMDDLEPNAYMDWYYGQSTYNRSFEDSFSLSVNGECSNEWCLKSSGYEVSSFTTSDESTRGSQSLKMTSSSISYPKIVFSENEKAGGSLIVLDAKVRLFSTCGGCISGTDCTSHAYFGYMDDFNVFYPVILINNGCNSNYFVDWTEYSYEIPDGEYRPAVYTRDGDMWVDNIKIIRTNAGTFNTTQPNFCASLNNCSNIQTHLPSNELGGLYWVVDYVAGATCSWSKNGISQGLMTEGTSGMYYANINHSVTSGSYDDVNLSATCDRIPFVTKSFFVSPRLYKYGLVENGSFEDEVYLDLTGDCSGGWCGIESSERFYATSSTKRSAGAQKSLLINSTATIAYTGLIFSENEYVGGSTISMDVMVEFVSGTSGSPSFSYGYVNDSNVFSQVGSLSGYVDWTNVEYEIPAGQYRVAFQVQKGHANFYVDNITSSLIKQGSDLTASNSLIDDEGEIGELVNFYSDYKDDYGNPILNADCVLSIGASDFEMSYDSSLKKYVVQYGFISSGEYAITHTCSSDNYSEQDDSYNIEILSPTAYSLIFTPISNVLSHSIYKRNISFGMSGESNDIVFKVTNYGNPLTATFNWASLSRSSSQQYSVYTSTNGVDWVFNDSIVFGSSLNFDDPIQKFARTNNHLYSFEDDFANEETIYYKLVYNQLPLAWQTIANSTSWVNVNQPSIYTDEYGYKWDLFADSNYSSIYSYTSKRFPELLTSDFNTGFELQFTAYSSSETTIQVGSVVGTTKNVESVAISTIPTRYSVPIDPTSNEARLLIASDGNNSEVYLTDYAIIPRAYFTSRLNVYNSDGSTLNAIINNETSQTYLREGIPFIIETSAYDVSGDLQRLNVQALIGGVVIKSQDFYLKDATKKDKVFSWYETIDGFVDLNGYADNPFTLRDVQIQATLYNTANKSVSIQTNTYKILQYPYFENDLIFNLYSVNAKVGESPKVRFNFFQKDPKQFVGFRVFIYDDDHSISDPNYSDTILNNVLKCTSFECSKEIEFTEYVYDANKHYKIAFLILLKTENENYLNPLTLRVFNQLVTYRTFETARILQVFERTDRTYRNDEKIQLVVQLRDEPYKNLLGDTSVYLTLDLCSGEVVGEGCYAFGTTKFYPTSKIYDEITGYNYFFFDHLFYDDSGNLLPDGNYIRFQAHINDQRYSHRVADIPTATLGDKCATGYGTLFNYSIFTMNFWENVWSSNRRILYGCETLTSPTIALHDEEEKRILIDVDHEVESNQNHSIACLKVDNSNFQNTLEQDLICAVYWNRSEQNVDKFVFTLGNEFSDYSKTGAEQQYLKFEVPAEQLIFNDAFMLQQSLENAEYQTDSLDTIGELTFFGFDKLFSGFANSLIEIPEGVTRMGLITNMGFDINFSNALDPEYVKGIFFFKIQGLKVINQYDYIRQYPELERLNPKHFTKFALDNKINLPIENTLVRIYTNDLTENRPLGDQLDVLSVRSPLIIFSERSKQQGVDGNYVQSITTLKFNLVSDMLSNNQTRTQRLYVPFIFSYVVPAKTGFFEIIDDILYGVDGYGNPAGLFTNPIGFGFKNWFWFVLILVVLVIVAKILKDLRANGGQITLPVITPFLESMKTNRDFKRGR